MEKHSPKPQTKLVKKNTSQYPEEEVILKCNNGPKESQVEASQNPEKRAVLVSCFRGNRKRSNASPIHEGQTKKNLQQKRNNSKNQKIREKLASYFQAIKR